MYNNVQADSTVVQRAHWVVCAHIWVTAHQILDTGQVSCRARGQCWAWESDALMSRQ